MDHVALIRNHYDELSASQKRLADFIISSPDSAFLTTTDLAKMSKVSQSAVVRFAQALGYSGFPQLQKELQRNLIGRLEPSARLNRSRGENKGDPGTQVLDTEIEHLHGIRPLIAGEAFENALSYIEASQTTYVMGIRASYSVAHLLSVTLGNVRPNVKLLSNASGAVADEIARISSRDALIVFSFPKYSVLTIKAMTYAASRQCKTIAITDSELSPTARIADATLAVPCTSPSFFTSYAAVTCLIEVMIARLTERFASEAVESLRNLEQLLESWEHWID